MPKSPRLVVLLVLASVSLSFAQSPSQPELRAGAASVEIALPQGVPLAGYGSVARRAFPYVHGYEYAKLFKPSTGTHDAIRAKSMVLISGDKKLLFVSLDVAGVTAEMYEDLLAKLAPLGYQRDQVFVAATHTHSGPGTLSRRWLWQFLASDRYQDKIYMQV